MGSTSSSCVDESSEWGGANRIHLASLVALLLRCIAEASPEERQYCPRQEAARTLNTRPTVCSEKERNTDLPIMVNAE